MITVFPTGDSGSECSDGVAAGRKQREPVWIGRYRIVGKDSAKVLGKAWTKRSRTPEGYPTRSRPEEALRRLFTSQAAAAKTSEKDDLRTRG